MFLLFSDVGVEKLVFIRTNDMMFMKQDAKQLGVGQLSYFDDEDDYVNIESDGDCLSSNFGS